MLLFVCQTIGDAFFVLGGLIIMATYKHFTLSDRISIEIYLKEGYSFKAIGRELNRDCTTIAKEVKKHITYKKQVDMAGYSITVSFAVIADIQNFVLTLDVNTVTAAFAPNVLLSVKISKKRNV